MGAPLAQQGNPRALPARTPGWAVRPETPAPVVAAPENSEQFLNRARGQLILLADPVAGADDTLVAAPTAGARAKGARRWWDRSSWDGTGRSKCSAREAWVASSSRGR